jgi:hypothetical protein
MRDTDSLDGQAQRSLQAEIGRCGAIADVLYGTMRGKTFSLGLTLKGSFVATKHARQPKRKVPRDGYATAVEQEKRPLVRFRIKTKDEGPFFSADKTVWN